MHVVLVSLLALATRGLQTVSLAVQSAMACPGVLLTQRSRMFQSHKTQHPDKGYAFPAIHCHVHML
jgi:hypothetical protein